MENVLFYVFKSVCFCFIFTLVRTFSMISNKNVRVDIFVLFLILWNQWWGFFFFFEALDSQDKLNLVMMDTLCYMLLTLICCCFVEDFCVCIHEEYLLEVFLWCLWWILVLGKCWNYKISQKFSFSCLISVNDCVEFILFFFLKHFVQFTHDTI